MIPWWRSFGHGEIAALALRGEDTLVAFFPCCFDARGALLLIGGGISDYQDVLCSDEIFAHAWTAFSKRLAARPAAWRCAFENLPECSPLLTLSAHEAPGGAPPVQDVCPVLHLDPAGIASCIPAHQWSNLRYYRRRAEKCGAVTIDRSTAESLERDLEDFFRLHGLRWRLSGQSGVLDNAAVRQFHREAAPLLLAAGNLHLYILRIDGRTAGALYALRDARRFYYYLGGFDPHFHALSPGTLLIGHAIEEAIAAGAQQFDFLRGREAYKYLWGAVDQPIYRRSVAADVGNELRAYPGERSSAQA